MDTTQYVHGYSDSEALRLNDQASTLDSIIHHDTLFPVGSLVLEAGCGVGAQTRIIAPMNPDSTFVSVDISEESIQEAKKMVESSGIANVKLRQANIYQLPFDDQTFDSVIICFVLEHLHNPAQALLEVKRVLKVGGTVMVIEGDHGSALFYPASQYAHRAINCQVRLQAQGGGNSNIGRELYPLLKAAEFSAITVSPRLVYVDASKPELVEGFIKNTFTAMIKGVGAQATQQGLTDKVTFERGIMDLYRTTESDGVFSYTFFKGFGRNM